MSRSRSIAALAFATFIAGTSFSAHALLPSIEVTCCQMPALGVGRPECKAFTPTAARCEVAIREFYETARAFEAAQKRAMQAQAAGLRDSSGAPVQSGSGQGWTLPSMAP